MTIEQLTDAYKSKDHALVIAADLKDRPHENKALAAKGVKQYKHYNFKQEVVVRKKQSVKVDVKATEKCSELGLLSLSFVTERATRPGNFTYLRASVHVYDIYEQENVSCRISAD